MVYRFRFEKEKDSFFCVCNFCSQIFLFPNIDLGCTDFFSEFQFEQALLSNPPTHQNSNFVRISKYVRKNGCSLSIKYEKVKILTCGSNYPECNELYFSGCVPPDPVTPSDQSQGAPQER